MKKLKILLLAFALTVVVSISTVAGAAMKVVDVSSWQGYYKVGSYNEDAVIIKATEGTSYVNPYMDYVFKQAKAQGKDVGFYHYSSGTNAAAEAKHFTDTIRPYLNDKSVAALPIQDWEMGDNHAWGNGAWAKSFNDNVKANTGIQPAIYTGSEGVAQTERYMAHDTALWFAGYPTMADVGWNPISFNTYYNTGAWKVLTGWQFSSTPVDKSFFYTDHAGWAKLAGKSTSKPNVKPTPQPNINVATASLEELATAAQQGKLGNGDARKAKLGDKYDSVQIIINERAGVITAAQSHAALAGQIVKYGRLGTGAERAHNLGTYSNAVQSIVNSQL